MSKVAFLTICIMLSQSACGPEGKVENIEVADSATLRHTVFDASFGLLSEIVGWAVVNDSVVVLADLDRLHLLNARSGEVRGGAGGEGDGPGEFRRIEWIQGSGKGALVAYDSNLGRLTHFDSALRVSSTQSLQGLDGRPECTLDDGSIITTRIVDYRGNTGREEGRYQPLLALESTDRGERRLIAHVQHAPQRVFVQTANFSRSIVLVAAPFSPKLRVRCSGVDVMWTDSTGNFVWRSGRASTQPLPLDGIEPRPITARALAAVVDSAERAVGRDFRILLEAAAEADPRSSTPGLADFATSSDGKLWVLTFGRDSLDRKVWSEHREDGTLVRRVAVPADFELGAVLPGLLVGHVVRHDGTAQIRVYSFE